MSIITAGPVRAGERLGALDVLRGVAVCGILLMNIPLMGWPSIGPGHPSGKPVLDADWISFLVQNVVFAGSMRGLFTLLFGAGMLIMLRSLDGDATQPPAQAYFTRCFALMLLGVAQFALFLWPGEILFNYGVTGLALFLFRRAKVRVLLTAAAAVLVTMSIAVGAPGLKRAETLRVAEAAAAAQAAKKPLTEAQTKALEARKEMLEKLHPTAAQLAEERGKRTSFPALLAWSTAFWVDFNLTGEAIAFLGESLAFMLLGMALFRMNVLAGERPLGFYVRLAAGGYAVGLTIRGLVQAAQWQAGFEPTPTLAALGGFLYEAGRLPTTLGLLGLVLALHKLRAFGALEGALKAIGRLALTNYTLESVLTSVLFYGFGFYDRFTFGGLMAICAAIWLVLGVFSVLWLRRWEMGPAEWLLRSLTYGRWQALGRTQRAGVAAAAPAE
ncbi:DUF418 domain-containing protein [Phenylobacterium sp.]|uniref:DUF418 domain-containing protein n=1 Tax=Phenylobacterium sp. TaxID=1871053 RepID=UPI0025D34785|nr:DUF418 domain-containing protein [Phenylobacterium sp.]